MVRVHPTSDIQSQNLGDNTQVWQFCVILPNAVIGSNCNVCAHVFIENDVVVGDNVTIKSGVQIWDGVSIEDNVFIGPNVTFTNDLIPRSKAYPDMYERTQICKGSSIGANSTIVAGIKIGEYAFVGAGSVVTKNIPSNTVWYGNPATHRGYITKEGVLLDLDMKDKNGQVQKLN
jgi:acetyltransferase-like isoleucine patch superfamily enzyme